MDELRYTYEDEHALLRDKWQWIVKHTPTCQNAQRGNLTQDWARHTFFQVSENALTELRRCGLHASTALLHQKSVLEQWQDA